MPYYAKVLQPNEQVLYNRKLHWIIYIVPMVGLIIFSLMALPAFFADTQDAGSYMVIVGFFILLCCCSFFSAWVRRMTTEVVITDKRILYKRGLLMRKTMEMNMNKVETVDVDQSILGRLFNYGTVYIRGAGSTYEPLRNVQCPLDLRNAIIVR